MSYTIQVVGRGEAIRYQTKGRMYVFEVSFASRQCRLYADTYSREDLGFAKSKVSENEQEIVERIKLWIESKDGCQVSVITEREPTPLRTADDILDERLRQRDLKR